MAIDWTVSQDGKEYVFNLREGVTYHNGDKFTAEDVVFTYERSRDPKNSIHSGVVANIKEAIAVDDHTVKFILKSPQASFLGKTLERSSGRAMGIVSRGALASMGDQEYALKAVGTGPFKVTAHTLGQDMVLERFENYYDPERPKLDKVIITPIPENEPLAAAIEAGDIQFISGNEVEPALVDRFRANPDIVVEAVPAPGFEGVFINPWRDPFKVPDFDKPLSELLQREGLHGPHGHRQGDRPRTATSNGPSSGMGFPPTAPSTRPWTFTSTSRSPNPVPRSSISLRHGGSSPAAGYPNGEGFPKLKILVRQDRRRDVQVISDILKKNLNIDTEVEPVDTTVSGQRFWAMDFDMLRIGSAADFDPDDGMVDWMMTTSKFNGSDAGQGDPALRAFSPKSGPTS